MLLRPIFQLRSAVSAPISQPQRSSGVARRTSDASRCGQIQELQVSQTRSVRSMVDKIEQEKNLRAIQQKARDRVQSERVERQNQKAETTKRARTSFVDFGGLSLSSCEYVASIPEKTLLEAGLEVIEDVGCGSQSMVQLAGITCDGASARNLPQGMFRCVKRFSKVGISTSRLQFMKCEHEVMQKLAPHANIAEAFDLFQDAECFYLEMAFHQGGDFTNLGHNALAAGVSLTQAWWGNIFKQCSDALAHMHELNVIHCDVKEPNLMLRTANCFEPEVVLIDFGVAQEVDEQRTVIYGTPGYIAPEVWDAKTWRKEGDMFSLGVVMLQLMLDRVPDSGNNCGIFVEDTISYRDVRAATQTREPPFECLPACYTQLGQLARQLLQKDPSLRPSATMMKAEIEALNESWTEIVEASNEAATPAPGMALCVPCEGSAAKHVCMERTGSWASASTAEGSFLSSDSE